MRKSRGLEIARSTSLRCSARRAFHQRAATFLHSFCKRLAAASSALDGTRIYLAQRGSRFDRRYAAGIMDGHHRLTKPEDTIERWVQQCLPAGCTVLDVAAGSGRHAAWLADRGHMVTAVDRNIEALQSRPHENVRVLAADLEAQPWPLPGERFDAVVVVNYLWRPLLADLFGSIAAGGHLLYETFAIGNEQFGRPRNPNFLLRENELQDVLPNDFDVIEYHHGEVGKPTRAVRQGLLAQRRR